jgi:hypothetical protein
LNQRWAKGVESYLIETVILLHINGVFIAHFSIFVSRMEETAEQILKEIALMSNIFGFCARHYISARHSAAFIIQVQIAILAEQIRVNDALKAQIADYVEELSRLAASKSTKESQSNHLD